MGIYKPTAIAGRTKNSVDQLTFCHLRGRNVVRTKIDENKSKTVPQQMQRKRWAELQALDAIFDEAVLIGFPSRLNYFTAHNAFVKLNAGAVKVSEELVVTTDYSKIACSQGRLIVPTVSVRVDEETRELTFTHKQERFGKRRMKTDQLYAMIVDKSLREGELFQLDTREDKDPVIVTIPDEWSFSNLAVYVFALSANGRMASNTGYIEVS